ncbi:ABC transporter permease [Mycoplasma corogypsi]|uniref:ABC transporter permease n=1 Tax=Mycoplasma corogypsi TaxID=2106 RepID=UPI0038739E6A
MSTFNTLLARNIKLFWRNKEKLVFLLLGPVITLFVFFFFVRKNFEPGTIHTRFLELSSVPEESLNALRKAGVIELHYSSEFTSNVTNYLFNGTLISGLITITGFTTAIQLSQNIVWDRENRTLDDFFIAPTRTTTIRLSYVVFNIIFNLMITLLTLFAIYTYIYAKFPDSPFTNYETFLSIVGITVLICLINSMFFVFVFSYVKTMSVFQVLNGLLSSVGGFLIGGYFPVSFLPNYLSAPISFIPQTQAGILLKNIATANQFITADFNTLTPDNIMFTINNGNANEMKTVLEFFKATHDPNYMTTAATFVKKLTDGINEGIINSAKVTIAGQEVEKYISVIYSLSMVALFTVLLLVLKVSRRK